MSFIVEDGTGRIDATSLTTVEFADDYFETRGVSAWTGSDAVKEQALIRATDYIEERWGRKLKGVVQFPEVPQSLSFPRLYIGFDSMVPPGVLKACAEYALRALTTSLMPDPGVSTGQVVESIRRKVGPIETETKYQVGVAPVQKQSYPLPDSMMRAFVAGSGLVRA